MSLRGGPAPLWLRHPRTAAPAGLCYGRLDVGWAAGAAAEIRTGLAAVPRSRAVWTSPARRCLDLAARLAARDGAAAVVDGRLDELDFGAWEGRYWAEIDRAESDPWAADPWRVAPPGGERFADLHARVAAVIAEAPADAVLVTHAGVIRAARMILTGASFAQVFAQPVPFARPIRLSRQAA